jgi:hypothetical protein
METIIPGGRSLSAAEGKGAGIGYMPKLSRNFLDFRSLLM